MTDILQHPYAQAFARALLHFLWQGALIGAIAYVLLRVCRLSPTARHTIGVALLAMMLAAPAVTTWDLAREARVASQTRVVSAATVVDSIDQRLVNTPLAPASPSSAIASSGAPIVSPTVVLALWLTGVVLLSIRLVGGWIVARRMAHRAIQLASPEVQSLARRVAGRLALDRVVRIVESSRIAVPVMVGWIKPVVILPTAALAGLTPLQIEALLAHELAHIRRHDYLVNLLQSAVETVLFYHPAVWWVSAEVRAAREQCCDDLAIGICDRLVYATALAELAAMASVPRLALAAADGSLVDRMRRVLGHPAKPRDERTAWLPIVIIAVVIGGLLPTAMTSAATDQSGVATGVQTGVATGVSGGVPDGVPGGVAGGVQGGVSGGAASGASGGVAEGVRSADPRVVPAPTEQSEKAAVAMVDMVAQLLAHAQQNYDGARRQVEIGTLAAVDVRDAEATLARLQEEIAALEQKGSKSVTDDDAALLKQKFAEAMRRLEVEETRFNVGVASVKSVDDALLAALEVAKKAASDQTSAAVAAEKSKAEKAAQADANLTFLRGQLEEAQQRFEYAKRQLASGLGSLSDVEVLSLRVRELELNLKASTKGLEANQVAAAERAKGEKVQTELAELKLEDAQMRLDRTRKLAAEGIVNAQAVQEAEIALKKAQLDLSKPVATRDESVVLSAPAAALRDRILREGASMSDDALIGLLKDAAKLSGDTDRAEVLLTFARQQTLTPEMATLYVAAAGGIKSENERTRVFKQPVRLRQGKGK